MHSKIDAYEKAVADVIAACNGDLHGALKALIIANEILESELVAVLATSGAQDYAMPRLH